MHKIGNELYKFVRWKETEEYYFTDLEHYHYILQKQLDELDEHIQNGETEKAMNEMADILFLSFEAIYAHEPREEMDGVVSRIRERGKDIRSRFEEIIDKYERD
jgi:hypothetical protein